MVYEIDEQSDFGSESEDIDIEDHLGPSSKMIELNKNIFNPSYQNK